MNKLGLIILFFFTWNFSIAQSLSNSAKVPFNLETLTRLSSRPDSIVPSFDGNRFYYNNIKNNQKISEKGFELAYPFGGFNYAIIKDAGKFGIIDRKGNLIVNPKDTRFTIYDRLRNYEDHLVVVSGEQSFNLMQGEFQRDWIGFVEPLSPTLFPFSKGTKKYGIKRTSANKEEIVNKPVFDTIYYIGHELIVASKKDKIGIISNSGRPLFKFNYDYFVLEGQNEPFAYSIIYETRLIGLFKNGKWEYYSLEKGKSKAILSCPLKCELLGNTIINNSLGIFKQDGKYKILFKDGTVASDGYDWLSDRATVGINDGKVYLIHPNGKRYQYY